MRLIISIIVISLVLISMVMDVKRIKSNKELIKKYDELLVSYEKVYNALNSKKELDIKTNEEFEKVNKNFEILKDKLTIDYELLTEEVIKRINEKQKIDSKTLINV